MIHSETGRRLALLHRDGFACRMCGKPGSVADLTIVRLGPLSAAKVDGPDALMTACASCARATPQRRIGDLFPRGPGSAALPKHGARKLSDF